MSPGDMLGLLIVAAGFVALVTLIVTAALALVRDTHAYRRAQGDHERTGR